MATPSSILVWKNPWTEEPCGLQSKIQWVAKSQTRLSTHTAMFHSLFTFLLFFYFYFLLYNTVLVLPYIDMNPPRVYFFKRKVFISQKCHEHAGVTVYLSLFFLIINILYYYDIFITNNKPIFSSVQFSYSVVFDFL